MNLTEHLERTGPYYYSGSGQFYSPQFVRSLTEAGQTSSQGSGGPSPNQVPYGAGSQGNGSFGHWYVGQIEPHFGFDPGNLPNIGFGNSEAAIVIPLGIIAQDIEFWVSFFDWLLGGSGAPPTPRELLSGRHPLYVRILGFRFWIVTETSAAPASGDMPDPAVHQVQDVAPWVQPFTDLDPFNFEKGEPPSLPFGLELKKETACREAAKKSPNDWAQFCSTLYKRK